MEEGLAHIRCTERAKNDSCSSWSGDLDCTLKGQHMTGNQSAPNWMTSHDLNVFHLFFFFSATTLWKNIYMDT